MIEIVKSEDRGRTRTDWPDSWDFPSFGCCDATQRKSCGLLRVLNDHWIAPGGGFGADGHRGMEL
jgi:redox-sensitive bicupin YhaK (pirin superfamily)